MKIIIEVECDDPRLGPDPRSRLLSALSALRDDVADSIANVDAWLADPPLSEWPVYFPHGARPPAIPVRIGRTLIA